MLESQMTFPAYSRVKYFGFKMNCLSRCKYCAQSTAIQPSSICTAADFYFPPKAGLQMTAFNAATFITFAELRSLSTLRISISSVARISG